MMDGKKPYLVVFLVQAMYAGGYLLSKVAFNGGMNSFVFLFYRQAVATIFLAPFAIIFERKSAPPLSFIVFCKIFMLCLIGFTFALNLYNVALIYTSATLAAATANTLPVITMFLAVLLRIETIKWRTISGIAKVLGVILCLAGAAILAFYKGPHINPLIHHHSFGHHNSEKYYVLNHTSITWVKGCFFMLIAFTLWSFWLVLQGKILVDFPSKLLFTTLQCFLSTVQAFIMAIAFERNLLRWKLHWDVGLLAVTYSGVMVTGVSCYLQAWCIEKKGPVFLAMSFPLSLIITIICSFFFLGELISLGSVLGGILLVGGLYSVLWGKSKEQRVDERIIVKDENDCLEVKEMA